MKFTIEVDEMGRISVNGIRFSKRMTLEEVIEEMQTYEKEEQMFLGEDLEYEEEVQTFEGEEYVEGYNPSTGRFEWDEIDENSISDSDSDSNSSPIYFDGIIDD